MLTSGEEILNKIRTLLSSAAHAFRELEHQPTRTSEESAAARGESLAVGAKALLLKTDDQFRLFVLPADQKLDSAAIRRELEVKKTRFATPEELLTLTGLVPGSVPPFGRPVLPFDLFGDSTIGSTEDKVAFNAGLLTHSIILPASVWKAVAQPQLFRFGSDA